MDTLTRMCEAQLETNDGDNSCQSIEYDIVRNHILTANRKGIITLWNASNWQRLHHINVLELYRKHNNNNQPEIPKNATPVTARNLKQPSKVEKVSNRKQSFFGNSNEFLNPADIPSKNILIVGTIIYLVKF